MNCKRFILIIVFALGLGCSNSSSPKLDNKFFVMDTATGYGNFDENAQLAKRLQFDGMCYTVPLQPQKYEGVADFANVLKTHELEFFTLYDNVSIDNGVCPNKLAQIAPLLEKSRTALWLALTSEQFQSRTPQGDSLALLTIKSIAEKAAEHKLNVILYPHTGFYAERVEHVVDLVEQSKLDNVFMTFNLCHWLKAEKGENLQSALDKSLPYLKMVTINGADSVRTGDENWEQLIQPLGKGDFDVYAFLKLLKEKGYNGPIGLQGYGIKQESILHLTQSFRMWMAFKERFK